MTPRVFFTFHYEQDFWRATQVRDVWVRQGGEALGIWEPPIWHEVVSGKVSPVTLIDQALAQADVTAALISGSVSSQDYVQYAIKESHKRGKGLLAIYVYKIQDQQGGHGIIGNTRFGEIDRDANNQSVFFWQRYPTYRWVIDEGPKNLKDWIEEAARASRR